MSQHDGSVNMIKYTNHSKNDQKIYMECELEEKYKKQELKTQKKERIKQVLCDTLTCSGNRAVNVLCSLFPILHWLPRYDHKKNLIRDIAAGFTVGIVQIPQGMAYALLANLPPIVGMYVSFFPVLLYPIFGTSKHISIGTFAVVSILISEVLHQRVPEPLCENQHVASTIFTAANPTNVSLSAMNSTMDCNELYEKTKIEIAVALSLCVGLIEVAMYILRLGIVTVFLSDSVVSGFVSGASIHVITSQIPKYLGIVVARRSGPFSLVQVYIDIIKNITNVNCETLILSLACTLFLVVGKELSARYGKKLPAPIPWELGIIVFCTIASKYGHFEEVHDVVVVGKIPTGISMSVPRISDMLLVFVDAIPLAIVAFTVEISLCQMFAKKHSYQIDCNQELLALGICNIFGSFFSCFPSASSLSRTVIYEEIGGITQLGGLFSSVVVLSVLLWIGPLFEHLPQAALAVIIIVNIRRLAFMWRNVKPLWKVSQLDAVTWLVAWFSVVLLGVGNGLLVGVCFSVFSVLLRTRRAKGTLVEPIASSEVYRDLNKFHTLQIPDELLIFRFSGPIYFANKDRFTQQIVEKLGYNPVEKWMQKKSFEPTEKKAFKKENDINSKPDLEKGNRDAKTLFNKIDFVPERSIETSITNHVDSVLDQSEEMTELTGSMSSNKGHTQKQKPAECVSHVIFDLNQCSFIDSDGVKILCDLYDAMSGLELKFMLVSCNEEVKHCLHQVWKDRGAVEYVSLKSAAECACLEISANKGSKTVSGERIEVNEKNVHHANIQNLKAHREFCHKGQRTEHCKKKKVRPEENTKIFRCFGRSRKVAKLANPEITNTSISQI